MKRLTTCCSCQQLVPFHQVLSDQHCATCQELLDTPGPHSKRARPVDGVWTLTGAVRGLLNCVRRVAQPAGDLTCNDGCYSTHRYNRHEASQRSEVMQRRPHCKMCVQRAAIMNGHQKVITSSELNTPVCYDRHHCQKACTHLRAACRAGCTSPPWPTSREHHAASTALRIRCLPRPS